MAAKKKSTRKRAPNAISPEELLRELPGARLVTHDAGMFIFREGSRASNCFLVTQGRARILNAVLTARTSVTSTRSGRSEDCLEKFA
jgi:hypothetical protein